MNRKFVLDTVRKAQAELSAEALIASLNIHAPSDISIEDIAMTRGALVVEGGLSGAEARLTRSPKLSFIRVNSGIREPGRKRFGIAHEIGHLELHREPCSLKICTQSNVVLFHSSDQKEIDANHFAAALLMPATMFETQCRTASPSLDLVSHLATRFRVSLTAACARYIQFCPHRCCMVVSTNGKIRYHRPTTDFGYFLQSSENLHPSSYAADLFAGQPTSAGMRSVPADAWLEGARIDSSKRILEHSVPMPTYESVLTLLWIDKDIDKYVTGDDEADAEQAGSDSRWSWNRYRREDE